MNLAEWRGWLPWKMCQEANTEVEYAESLHTVSRLPPLLNGFAFWNVVLLVYMVASYGYPIIQFFILETYGTPPWSI